MEKVRKASPFRNVAWQQLWKMVSSSTRCDQKTFRLSLHSKTDLLYQTSTKPTIRWKAYWSTSINFSLVLAQILKSTQPPTPFDCRFVTLATCTPLAVASTCLRCKNAPLERQYWCWNADSRVNHDRSKKTWIEQRRNWRQLWWYLSNIMRNRDMRFYFVSEHVLNRTRCIIWGDGLIHARHARTATGPRFDDNFIAGQSRPLHSM